MEEGNVSKLDTVLRTHHLAGAGIKSDSVQQDSIELHQRILRSFKILDYNLFNGQQSDAVME